MFAEAIGETWEDNLRLAGEALNRSAEAEELLAAYEERADRPAGRRVGAR
ncbi:iron complex transport system substrate-binding protein [Geodermatophilus africanus]|uniref:Iron complex transport system substrate-binding protein n=1 Tax=Geodermatophilus africanus TaxID=1137993 RepID=A0A1H3NGY5_9ACTN|nr:iron complex transport system substrate-binding protein [Geodermatophilus africanus]